MSKKGYDILSWIWLGLLIVTFTYMWYSSNSAISDLSNRGIEAANSGNFSQIEDYMKNATVPQEVIQAYSLKYLLHGLGTIYSIIIFALCFKLKVGTLEKIIVLVGGIMTYGGLAILTYFFDVRKKFKEIRKTDNLLQP